MTRLCVTFCAGVRGGPPSGVVTFLFTDSEGSTRRWETDAGAMHDQIDQAQAALKTGSK
jgi:class 3 adenylate cyclase